MKGTGQIWQIDPPLIKTANKNSEPDGKVMATMEKALKAD